MVADVNLNDARAAMLIWVKRIAKDMNVVVEYNPKVFDTTEEILSRDSRGPVGRVALNIIEYRQVADACWIPARLSQRAARGTGAVRNAGEAK
jgi:hypothetical protein